ncbi:MAG: hypothetical protein OXP37_01770, partial [Chloroflexota bacterium]|nr:hypothetical protein [Chloroflexota bacterium]
MTWSGLARGPAALLALALLALFALTPQPAGAQQATQALVNNFGQANGGTGNFVQHDHAQAFTTGANAGGYTLTGVDFSFPQINDGALAGKLAAEIRSDSGGAPGAVVATLTKPGTIAAGTNSFTHSGVALAANTTY